MSGVAAWGDRKGGLFSSILCLRVFRIVENFSRSKLCTCNSAIHLIGYRLLSQLITYESDRITCCFCFWKCGTIRIQNDMQEFKTRDQNADLPIASSSLLRDINIQN